MCEEVLADLYVQLAYSPFSSPLLTCTSRSSASDPDWLTMSLRYTNPSGAHPSGYIGEVSWRVPRSPLAVLTLPLTTGPHQRRQPHAPRDSRPPGQARACQGALDPVYLDTRILITHFNRSTAPTTTHQTARACETLSTSSTSPRLTSPPFDTCARASL